MRKAVGVTALLVLAWPSGAHAREAAAPAGGAALDQVIIATAGAVVLSVVLLALGLGHRSGRVGLVSVWADLSRRIGGLPGWCGVPAVVVTVSLVVALVGFLWDVSIHIDEGRDEGPLANSAHFLILGGLFGIFTAGFLACVMPLEKPTPSSIRVTGEWYAPLGGVLILASGMFALTGFPIDDVWHRIFGQDLTLWGPTHLMLIGGAAMSLIGLSVLLVEGRRVAAEDPDLPPEPRWVVWSQRIALSGGLLIGLCVFPVEFDFGVPQFRLVFGPVLIMLAAGVGLVASRIWLGPGTALAAVLFFLALRGLVSLLVGPVLGQTTPGFHLFLGSALVIEAVFLLLAKRPLLTRTLVAGLGIGTLGLASEWAWSELVIPIPWTSELMLWEGIGLGLAAALAGSVVGAWVGERLASDELPRLRSTRIAAIAGALAIFAIVGYALNKPGVEGVHAEVTLDQTRTGSERAAVPTIRFSPPDAPEGAELLNVTAWQGGGLVLEPLVAAGSAGTYTTKNPIPIHGEWKSLIRMSRGNTLSAVPIYLPADPEIPAAAVRADDSFTRPFVPDHEILQREQKDVAGWLAGVSYLVVAMIALALLTLIAWALHRLAVIPEIHRRN